MNSHPDAFRDWDSAYLLGILGPDDRRTFQHHLSTCAACSAAVADLAGMPGILSGLSTAEAVALTLAPDDERVLAGLQEPDLVQRLATSDAVTHPDVTDAVTRLNARNIPCFALLNDFAQGVRQNYLGLNNMKVGRIAAHMIVTATHQPGKIAVFVGGYRWHGHELRETGFRSYFREFAPQFRVLDTLVNLETRQLTYEATLDLLGRHPDLRGIYCAGGGMEGAIAAIREVRAPGEVALIVNELTPESRAALISRHVTMAIATPLQRLCSDLIGLTGDAVLNGVPPFAGQHFLPPDLYLPESV